MRGLFFQSNQERAMIQSIEILVFTGLIECALIFAKAIKQEHFPW